jgi:lysophospholipase L1-like esterase
MDRTPLLLCIAAAALGFSASGLRSEPATAFTNPTLVRANDPSFTYEGRLDTSDPKGPVLVWEASTASIDFTGDSVCVLFGRCSGTAFFNATVDDSTTIIELKDGQKDVTSCLLAMGLGPHHLRLFKRSEAAAGSARFDGVRIAAGARVEKPAAGRRLRFEIYGDSITAGACDEDGPSDQWESRRTHNAAYSWAALTSAAFSADYRNISVSGIGLATGFDDVLEGQVWDRIYPTAAAPKADLTVWTPDAVFVLLGDNDDAFPRSKKLPFPADFPEKYTAFVHHLRSTYPKAAIILLNGGMWAGVNSEWLGPTWNATVKALEAEDPALHHFTFQHWTMNHPRVADHKAMADELDAWLKAQPFMVSLGAGRN